MARVRTWPQSKPSLPVKFLILVEIPPLKLRFSSTMTPLLVQRFHRVGHPIPAAVAAAREVLDKPKYLVPVPADACVAAACAECTCAECS